MHISVRLRIFLARHAWVRWAVALLLAGIVAWSSLRHSAAVERERRAWGDTVDVLVSTTDLEPGDPIDVTPTALPAAMVPPAALTAVPDDAIVRYPVADGAVLTGRDISSGIGPAALAPPGSLVVGVRDPLAEAAAVGSDVIVVSEGVVLAADATIVGVDDEGVILVAVPAASGPTVAAAAHVGAASVLFVP